MTDDDPAPEADPDAEPSEAPALDGDDHESAPELDPDDDRPELPGETASERSGPLGDLATRVDEQRRGRDDAEFDDLFEEYDADTVDSEALWEQVGSDEPFDVDPHGDGPERRVVEKSNYCQSCRFFSAPPDVACTHQGTEILEVVDLDHFEVFNCPIVREDENLENL